MKHVNEKMIHPDALSLPQERPKRSNLLSVAFKLEPWKDEFLTQAAISLGKSKSDFFRSAVTIIINRISEKYGDRPEFADVMKIRQKDAGL